ncbi:MAG: UDP-N-acetylglucosamine pyrophosphorylase, partial [Clostridia bacterium]|nr:UDP-N-acetylglucosamine pyrophosphorylase [Clostridia bacterium]
MIKIIDLYDLSHTVAEEYLKGFSYPWEALKGISAMIVSLGEKLDGDYIQAAPNVWIHKSAKIAPTAYIGAPAIIGADTEVRHCAYIRGSALVDSGCV